MSFNRSRLIVDANQCPTPPLLKLLEVLNISNDGTLPNILKACSVNWCQPGKERWEFKELYSDKKAKAWPILKDLGCINPFRAQNVYYDCAILLGGHAKRVHRRIQFLKNEWNRGVRFKKLIFLTGARPPDPETEKFASHLSTETKMLCFLFEQSELPKDMRKLPKMIIDTPLQKKQDGKLMRPNTCDTIREWMKNSIGPGKYLAISCQPFVGYHDACLRACLPSTIALETIGPKADTGLFFSIFLYNIEHWLEQIHHYSL